MSVWFVLAGAIVAEVAATIALRFSDGFTRPWPSVLVVIGYGVAFWLLARVVQQLQAGVTYAVWAGAGTALVALVGVLALGETMTWAKAVSLVLIVAGVMGLNLFSGSPAAPHAASAAPVGPAAASAEASDGVRR